MQIKVVITGDQRVGKSELARAMVGEECHGRYDPNTPVTIKHGRHPEMKATNIRYQDSLQIIDFPYDFMMQNRYYENDFSDVVIIAFDVSNRESFSRAMGHYNVIKGYRGRVIQARGDRPVLFRVVGLKADVSSDLREVTIDEAKKVADELGIEYMEVSANTGANVGNLVNGIVNEVKEKNIVQNLEKNAIHLMVRYLKDQFENEKFETSLNNSSRLKYTINERRDGVLHINVEKGCRVPKIIAEFYKLCKDAIEKDDKDAYEENVQKIIEKLKSVEVIDNDTSVGQTLLGLNTVLTDLGFECLEIEYEEEMVDEKKDADAVEKEEVLEENEAHEEAIKKEALQLKVTVLGAEQAGKSTLVNRFVQGDQFTPTTGRDIYGVKFQKKSVEIDGDQVEFELTTVTSNERYRGHHNDFRRADSADVVVITYRVDYADSFKAIEDIREEVINARSAAGKQLPIFKLVGTHADCAEEERKVSKEVAKEKAKELGMTYMEVSAHKGTNVTQLFNEMAFDFKKKSLEADERASEVKQQRTNKEAIEEIKKFILSEMSTYNDTIGFFGSRKMSCDAQMYRVPKSIQKIVELCEASDDNEVNCQKNLQKIKNIVNNYELRNDNSKWDKVIIKLRNFFAAIGLGLSQSSRNTIFGDVAKKFNPDMHHAKKEVEVADLRKSIDRRA